MIPTAQGWPSAPAAPPPPPPPSPQSPAPRRRRLAVVAIAAAGALIVGGAVGLTAGLLTRGNGSGPSGASNAPSAESSGTAQARTLYRQALAAAGASAGFHYVANSTGGANQTFIGDAGRSGGSQQITMDSTYGPEQFTLVLVGGTVYFRGNGPALQDQLGVPAANAPGLAGKWVSISRADGPYGVVAPGITVADQVQQTVLVPASTQTLPGGAVRLIGTVPALQGGAGGTGHLDVAATSHLPTSYVVSISGGAAASTSTTTFSGWGKAPSVTAPSGAVAWSTLGASQPPGGYGSGGAGNPSATPQT